MSIWGLKTRNVDIKTFNMKATKINQHHITKKCLYNPVPVIGVPN